MQDIVVAGGGIAGLYVARELGRRGREVRLLEATDRLGGRIETGELVPPPTAGGEPHRAEFGPMRFELEISPLFKGLLDDYGIATTPFAPPSSPEPPVEYPVAVDERGADGTPLSALELLKLGVFRLFDQETVISSAGPAPRVELLAAGREWLRDLGDDGGFDVLRRTAVMPGTGGQALHQHGFWNALYSQLSPMAVAKILHFGTFYHLMPDNPNAVEWSIFWLRLFKLGDAPLSTIDAGVERLTEALVAELDTLDAVTVECERAVTGVRPSEAGGGAVTVHIGATGELIDARHVVLALPKQPLVELSSHFPERIRRDLDAVIAFPLLKVFCVTETPRWWRTEPPRAQDGAWNAPTREIHYLPATPAGASRTPPEHTLVLLYTDRPGTSYWQPYLDSPERHDRAEVNRNEQLRNSLASLLFNLHWEWAKKEAGIGDRVGGHALSSWAGRRAAWALGEFFADTLGQVRPGDREWEVLARRFPGLLGDPACILFAPEKVLEWQRDAIGDYAIRDWSRPPYGAGCHAWAPEHRSWEVRDRLAGFGLEGHEDAANVHVCGEAYSDYQGFIEGALRSAEDALARVP